MRKIHETAERRHTQERNEKKWEIGMGIWMK